MTKGSSPRRLFSRVDCVSEDDFTSLQHEEGFPVFLVIPSLGLMFPDCIELPAPHSCGFAHMLLLRHIVRWVPRRSLCPPSYQKQMDLWFLCRSTCRHCEGSSYYHSDHHESRPKPRQMRLCDGITSGLDVKSRCFSLPLDLHLNFGPHTGISLGSCHDQRVSVLAGHRPFELIVVVPSRCCARVLCCHRLYCLLLIYELHCPRCLVRVSSCYTRFSRQVLSATVLLDPCVYADIKVINALESCGTTGRVILRLLTVI
ncbi:hypothetical protein FHG87_001664 [Trinorchestia longiramus]|nr:hypothetical protein FHG87_001664 [Trinorchestia longiramus]